MVHHVFNREFHRKQDLTRTCALEHCSRCPYLNRRESCSTKRVIRGMRVESSHPEWTQTGVLARLGPFLCGCDIEKDHVMTRFRSPVPHTEIPHTNIRKLQHRRRGEINIPSIWCIGPNAHDERKRRSGWPFVEDGAKVTLPVRRPKKFDELRKFR